jgi:hypothetical protein
MPMPGLSSVQLSPSAAAAPEYGRTAVPGERVSDEVDPKTINRSTSKNYEEPSIPNGDQVVY